MSRSLIRRKRAFAWLLVRGVLHGAYTPLTAIRVWRELEWRSNPWADLRAQVDECGCQADFTSVSGPIWEFDDTANPTIVEDEE